jgi:serine protease 16
MKFRIFFTSIFLVTFALVQSLESRPWKRRKKQQSFSSSSTVDSSLFFDQVQDHNDATNTKTWKQRYFLNQTFFNGEGPVFLCVGGEGPPLTELVAITGEYHCGWMIILAQRHKALILALEHRFYGSSQPTSDLSTENLARFLSSDQALDDLVQFREHIVKEFNLSPSNKWVTFGCSYPGMLAAWSQSKFPHLIHAAVSSSAPIQAKVSQHCSLDAPRGGWHRHVGRRR